MSGLYIIYTQEGEGLARYLCELKTCVCNGTNSTRAEQLAYKKHGVSYVLKIQDAMDIAPDYSDMLNSIGITDPKEQETVISYLSSLIDIVLERWIE